jgi:hypothetical protein
MNPIFIEYYSHESCDCYKIKNPWTSYREEKIVLCKESEGLELAEFIAVGVLNKKLAEALKEKIV